MEKNEAAGWKMGRREYAPGNSTDPAALAKIDASSGAEGRSRRPL
jgi:hypothetical protein